MWDAGDGDDDDEEMNNVSVRALFQQHHAQCPHIFPILELEAVTATCFSSAKGASTS